MVAQTRRLDDILPLVFGAWPLFALLPELLAPGQNVTIIAILGIHYAVLGLLIAWFLATHSAPLGSPTKRPAVLILCGLLLWAALVTLVFAENRIYGLLKLVELSGFILAGLAATHLYRRAGDAFAAHLLRALATGLILALLLSMTADLVFRDAFEGTRIPGFIHIRIFGFSAAIAIALSIGWIASSPFDHRESAPAYVLLFVSWTVLFWSASRGGIISILLAFALLATLIKPLRRVWLHVLTAMAIGFAAALVLPGLGNSGATTILAHDLEINNLSSGRWALWERVIGFIQERPLTGHGYAQYYALAVEAGDAPERAMPHVHNIVLEAWLAIGGLATVLLAGLVLWSWLGWLRSERAASSEAGIGSLLGVTTLLAYALLDGVYFYPEAALPFAVMAGILVARRDIDRTEWNGRTC